MQRGASNMTELMTEAWNLIQNLPEEKVGQVVTYIKNINFDVEKHDDIFFSERKKAFQRLDSLNIQVPDDFDYKKELAEARNEKYGNLT